MIINIKEYFNDDYTTREAGEKLRHLITQANELVTLDFKDLQIASASFMDEGIAKLAFEGWTSKDFKEKLDFQNIFSKDLELIKHCCKIRKINLERN